MLIIACHFSICRHPRLLPCYARFSPLLFTLFAAFSLLRCCHAADARCLRRYAAADAERAMIRRYVASTPLFMAAMFTTPMLRHAAIIDVTPRCHFAATLYAMPLADA